MKELNKNMYKMMNRIRVFEKKALDLHSKGNMPGLLHSYIGEEAIATGVSLNLRREDYVTSTHRGHGHSVAKGLDLGKMMAELLGKATGYNKGKGGSMHVVDMKSGLLQCNGIVGGGIAIATGAGWTIKLQGSDLVSIAFFGDGAMNRGSFHEALNIASIWKLPVVYICENNQYAISAPSSEFVAVDKFEKRAESYNIPGYAVDGNNVIEVYEKAKMVIENARNGGGPSLLVCHTCRQRAHDESDPQIYRSREDIEKCKRSDPIPRFISQALKNSWLSENDIKTIDQATEKEVLIAAEFALNSPLPNPKDALNDVFVGEVKCDE